MKTTTVIIMVHTASAAHGIGAGITTHGIHGALLLGDTTDGMTHGTIARAGAGTTLGTTADTGAAGTTHGITEASGEADGTIPDIIRTTAGTIHTGATTITTMVRDIILTITRMYGMDQDIRQAQTGSLQAHHHSEEALAAEAQSAETNLQDAQHRLQSERLHQEGHP